MNNVLFWHWGHSLPTPVEGGGSEVYADNETVLEITVDYPDFPFYFQDVQGSVNHYDWGDGVPSSSASHVFQNTGVYIVKIVGDITHFKVGKENNSNLLPTRIIKVASSITDFSDTFRNCQKITSIPVGLFDNNVNATNFSGCFAYCNITSLPVRLFDKNVNATNFSSCFEYNEMTSIPSGFFDNNVNATNFRRCFFGSVLLTSIPVGLFDNNVNATDFSGCFANCMNLASVPDRLFSGKSLVTSFKGCFVGSKKITSIPSDLFLGCSSAVNFERCFALTGLTSVPPNLFSTCLNALNFHYCFSETNIVSVPLDLFDKNLKATIFSYCFYSCKLLKNRPKPDGLEMWQIAGTIGRPNSIDLDCMFWICTSMPDYNSLPSSVRFYR